MLVDNTTSTWDEENSMLWIKMIYKAPLMSHSYELQLITVRRLPRKLKKRLKKQGK